MAVGTRMKGRIGMVTLWAAAGGCRSTPAGSAMVLSQTPPTVQAAFGADHPNTVAETVMRAPQGGQDYYTVQYKAADGSEHDVVFNEAGNEVDNH